MLKRLQSLPWFVRWPLKWCIVGVTLFAVSFPNPLLFVRHVQHWRDPNAMIDPAHPDLQPWVEALNARIDPDMPPRKALQTVQKFVMEKVPYEWDWNTWGSADYLPTLPEVLEMGREDCDGRAVVAASLLRNLGFQAELVTDFAHVWVKTDKGETMSPGKRKSIEAGEQGVRVHWTLISETLPQALAYSVSPFPLVRELILLVVVWLVLLAPGVGWRARVLGLVLMLEGLLFLRVAGVNWNRPVVWAQWWGGLHIAAGAGMLAAAGYRAMRRGRRPLERPSIPAPG